MSSRYKNEIQNADVWGSLKHLSRGSLATIAILVVLSEGVVFSPSNASYGSSYESVSRETYRFSSPSSMKASTCNSLLESPPRTLSPLALDGAQRSVGKVAVLGLIYGVRFAIEPAKNHHISVSAPKSYTLDRTALSVAAYRDCLKRHALDGQKKDMRSDESV